MEAPKDFSQQLIQTASLLATAGKGILAADESPGSIEKKFKSLPLENTAENRRLYRNMLITAPGIENYISGVIFQEETVRQLTNTGVTFAQYVKSKNIVAGIKVDKGLGELNLAKENYTKGIDALHTMAKQFYGLGCRFAKWRAVLQINTEKGTPSEQAIHQNAYNLARYAAICQANGLVPIVEPEILPDGPHSAETCQKVTEKILTRVFYELQQAGVLLEGCLLKPNMVTYGSEHPGKTQQWLQEEAVRTVRALSRTVPPALPGIVFLSGGQTEEEASLHLNFMNRITTIQRPWALSFSFGRALQNSAIKAWCGKEDQVKAGQDALLARAQANSQARKGTYAGSGDKAANQVLFEKGYAY